MTLFKNFKYYNLSSASRGKWIHTKMYKPQSATKNKHSTKKLSQDNQNPKKNEQNEHRNQKAINQQNVQSTWFRSNSLKYLSENVGRNRRWYRQMFGYVRSAGLEISEGNIEAIQHFQWWRI